MTKTKTYRKSSRSATNDQCVEVANTLDGARDSKNPVAELAFDGSGFSDFLRMTKDDTLAP